MIEKLPADLRTELVGHIFSPLMQSVPVFAFIRSSVDPVQSTRFLAKVANMFEYRTLVPQEQLVDFSDDCDRLFILVDGEVVTHARNLPTLYTSPQPPLPPPRTRRRPSRSLSTRLLMLVDGQVVVDIEHPSMDVKPMHLQPGDYIGDFGILGEDDWGASTMFNLTVNREGEPVEIRVSAHHGKYAVLLQLLRDAFQGALSNAVFDVQQCVGMFCSTWQQEKIDAGALDGYSRAHLLHWGIITKRMLQRDRRLLRRHSTKLDKVKRERAEEHESVQRWQCPMYGCCITAI